MLKSTVRVRWGVDVQAANLSGVPSPATAPRGLRLQMQTCELLSLAWLGVCFTYKVQVWE